MKNKILKEILEGSVLGLVIASMFAGAVKINAAFANRPLSQEYIFYCEEAGSRYGICPELLQAIIEQESGGNPDAVGQAGEVGLMQIYPRYHEIRALHLNVYDLFDPEGNILVGSDYLAELFLEYGDIGTVLMIYNGTEDAKLRGEQADYTEYALDIMHRAEQLERLHRK